MAVILWLGKNLATILGVVQAVIKLLKELLTGIVNIFFPLFPDNGSFENAVTAVRGFVDKADAFIQQIKELVLGNG